MSDTAFRFAWPELLGDVLDVSLKDHLDEIDIAWEGLPKLLDCLDGREVAVLKMRYAEKLSLEETGKRITRRDGKKGRITKETIRQIEQRALRKMRRQAKMGIIKSCIAGYWKVLQFRQPNRPLKKSNDYPQLPQAIPE